MNTSWAELEGGGTLRQSGSSHTGATKAFMVPTFSTWNVKRFLCSHLFIRTFHSMVLSNGADLGDEDIVVKTFPEVII